MPNPLTDAAALSPPNLTGYRYFDANLVGGGFLHNQFAFKLRNATYLADAALLAYAPESFAWPWFAKAGLTQGGFFSGLSTQAYAAIADAFVIVCFRGTEVRDPFDFSVDLFLSDARFTPTPWNGVGNVHRGFALALDEVWNGAAGIKGFLAAHAVGPAGSRVVWFTGHSLGAALATLAAARYAGGPRGLYTFASPRVGDKAFATKFPDAFASTLPVAAAYRFVHANDAVPRLPPPKLGFKHVGEPWLIEKNGRVSQASNRLTAPGDTLHGDAIDLIGAIRLNVIDHAPIYYATKVWNAFVAAQNESPDEEV